MDRLRSFNFKTFNEAGSVIHNITDNDTEKEVYHLSIPYSHLKESIKKIIISSANSSTVLSLCEVEIYGDCPSGKWGLDCRNICPYLCHEECDKETGSCSFCNGFTNPPECTKVCNSSYYGRNCAQPCNANCDLYGCKSVTGECIRCKPGYQSPSCVNQCMQGKWGQNCERSCEAKCNGLVCSPVNGDCLKGCIGFSNNPKCTTECNTGQWGFQCSKFCNNCYNLNCNKRDGYCLEGCLGFSNPPFCSKECKQGKYGLNCQQNCSTTCRQSLCNHDNGECKGCELGYQGENCSQECKPGTYGLNCQSNCSSTCNKSLCNHVDGKCNGCESGYQGTYCDQECNPTFHGQGCAKKCNTSCVDQLCNPIDGECYNCSIGRQGAQCDFCPTGSFGEDCFRNCSDNCLVGSCHPENGTCHQGCKDGYEGEMCMMAIQSSPKVGGTVGLIIFITVLATGILAGILLWRFQHDICKNGRKAHNADTENTVLSVLSTQENERDMPVADFIYNNLESQMQDTSMTINEFNVLMSNHKFEYFQDQFKSLPLPKNVSMDVGNSIQNKNKNRYKDICTYDHSRVCLATNADKNEGDYINASYIKGTDDEVRFIASQGPTQEMLNDFVRMLWEKNVEIVVMLTNLIEGGKEKCEKYWPDAGKARFGEITVKLITIKSFADYTIRSFIVFKNDKEVIRKCTQFHFTSWPDKGVPLTPWSLIGFLKKVSSQSTKSPVVVHCSAGVGRTGTFIAIDNVIRQAQETGRVDFYKTLVKLRQDRVLMIQTAEQYFFLHKAVQAAILCTNTNVTTMNCTDIVKTFEVKTITGKTNLADEFMGLCAVCESFYNDTRDILHEIDNNGDVYENSLNVNLNLKNRYPSIVPNQRFRPYLSCESKDMEDYINAVFVPGFYEKDRQLLTQLPLPTTVVDFWRLVSQYDVSLIVAFEIDAMANDKTFGNYLPAGEDKTLICPPFEILAYNKKQEMLWEESRLHVQTEKPKLSEPTSLDQRRSVIHLKCLFTDLSPNNLLSLLSQVRSYDTQSQGRTLYTCRNGAYYSGLICVLSLLLDRIENGSFVGVPIVVGEMKSIRLEVIPTKEQYRVIYDVVVRYFEASKHNNNVDSSSCIKTTGGSSVKNENCNEPDDANVYANI